MERFCGNSQSVKPVDCFRRRASLLIFEGILNVTLTEELFTTGVTQGNLELTLPPNSLDSHKNKNNKMKSYTDPKSSFSLRRTHPLAR